MGKKNYGVELQPSLTQLLDKRANETIGKETKQENKKQPAKNDDAEEEEKQEAKNAKESVEEKTAKESVETKQVKTTRTSSKSKSVVERWKDLSIEYRVSKVGEGGFIIYVDSDVKQKFEILKTCFPTRMPTKAIINAALRIFLDDNKEELNKILKEATMID